MAKIPRVVSLQSTFGCCLNVVDLALKRIVHSVEDVLVREGSRKHRVVQRRVVAHCSTGLVMLAVPNGTLGLVWYLTLSST